MEKKSKQRKVKAKNPVASHMKIEFQKHWDFFQSQCEEYEAHLNTICNMTCDNIWKMYTDKLNSLPVNVCNMTMSEYMEMQKSIEIQEKKTTSFSSEFEKNITMTVVHNNFKGDYSGGTKVKRREPDEIQRFFTIMLADTVALKLPNILEGFNEFWANNHSTPGMIPYIHLDPSPTTICLTWKVPKLCNSQTYIFIDKEPSSNTRARDRIFIKGIEHFSANGIFQYSFNNLPPGTTFKFRMKAFTNSVKSSYSSCIETSILNMTPEPPEMNCVEWSNYSLTLSWQNISKEDISYYVVQMQTAMRTFFILYQGLSYSCLLDMFIPNKEYFFRISAFCSAGRSDYSKLYSFKTLLHLYKPEIYGCESSDEDSQESEEEEEGQSLLMSMVPVVYPPPPRSGLGQSLLTSMVPNPPLPSSCLEVVRVDPSPKQVSEFKFTYHPPTEKFGVELCTKDFNALNPGTFLNDTIIEFYLKYLFCEKLTKREKEKTYIFSSFFFSKLMMFETCPDDVPQDEFQMLQHDYVKTWTRRLDLFSNDFLIVPINQSYHWMVVIICFPGLAPDICDNDAEHYNLNDENAASSFDGNSKTEERRPCICIFDSLKRIDVCHNYATLLRAYLDSEWTVRKGTKKLFNMYTMPDYNVNCPQQPNGYDCGIFMLQNVETFFENQIPYFEECVLDSKSWFSMETAMKKRQEIQTLLLELVKKS